MDSSSVSHSAFMINILFPVLAVLGAYFIGSVSSAIITCKLMRLPDPRESGSGNPGATNVLRVGGKKAALITLLGDGLKGFIPVKIIILLGFSDLIVALASLAAFVGHLYPIFFKFKGGKGVATCLGALIALNLVLSLMVLGVWILVFALLRFSSLAALTGIAAGLIYGWHLMPPAYYIAFAIMGLTLYWRHRGNIERLIKGTEPKFGSKKKQENSKAENKAS